MTRQVVADHSVRRGEDVLGRAVVLLELDHRGVGIFFIEVKYVFNRSSAETVYRLVVVADDHDVVVSSADQPYKLKLRAVRVLILVNADISESLLIVVAGFGVGLEQLHRLHNQVVEIERGGVDELRLVEPVNLGDLLQPEIAAGVALESVRIDELVLGARNRVHRTPDREHLLVERQLLLAGGYQPLLILAVVYGEGRRIADPLAVFAQYADADRMECTRPDIAGDIRVAEYGA